jgi:hypothetical protein
VADQAARPGQLDGLGKMDAPEAGGGHQDERGDVVAQSFCQRGGDSTTERMPDQRELVNPELRQDGLHVARVGGDAVAGRAIGVAKAG